MGMWSYFTQDTHKRIVNDVPMRVIMRDDKGNKWVEECYEGYGVFGGKDFYELVAEMNGYVLYFDKEFDFDKEFGWVVEHGDEHHYFIKEEDAKEFMRQKGIDMAFDGHPHGDNPAIKYPSLTENGWYCDGQCPESDPDQGFPEEEMYNDDED